MIQIHHALLLAAIAVTPAQKPAPQPAVELSPAYQRLAELRAITETAGLVDALKEAGFACAPPAGAYYVLAAIRGLTQDDDATFARRLVADPGIGAVPGSSFWRAGAPEGKRLIRFAFPKKLETLREAARRLASIAQRT